MERPVIIRAVTIANDSFIDECAAMYQIRHYVTRDGRDVFLDWLTKLRDTTAKVAISRRINRIEQENFGDHKFVRDGVWELRIDAGPGYRAYYAVAGKQVILLLCGGDKRTQEADIDRACAYWQDWKRRADNER